MQRIELTLREFAETFGGKKAKYSEVRDFIESRRPEWVRALVPRIIEASGIYWAQKMLAVAAVEAALCDQLPTQGGARTDRTCTAVEGHMGQLLEYDVPNIPRVKGTSGSGVENGVAAGHVSGCYTIPVSRTGLYVS